MADRGLVHRGSSDQDGCDRRKGHEEGGGINLDKSAAPFINHDSYSPQNRGEDDGNQAQPVCVDAAGLGENGIGPHCGEGSTGAGAEKSPNSPGAESEEQQDPRGNPQEKPRFLAADVKGQKIVENLDPITVHCDGCTQTLPFKSPDHSGVIKGNDQPHDAHEGHGGKSHTGGDDLFIPLNPVEKFAVTISKARVENRGHDHADQKSR